MIAAARVVVVVAAAAPRAIRARVINRAVMIAARVVAKIQKLAVIPWVIRAVIKVTQIAVAVLIPMTPKKQPTGLLILKFNIIIIVHMIGRLNMVIIYIIGHI